MKEQNYLEALYDFLKKEDPNGNMVDGDIRDSYIPNKRVFESTAPDSKAELMQKTEADKPKADVFEKYESSAGISAEDVFGGGKFSLKLSGEDVKRSDSSAYRYSPSESREAKVSVPPIESAEERVPRPSAISNAPFGERIPKASTPDTGSLEEHVSHLSIQRAEDSTEYVPNISTPSVEILDVPLSNPSVLSEDTVEAQKTELSADSEGRSEVSAPSKKPSIFDVLKKYVSVTSASKREQTSETSDTAQPPEDEKATAPQELASDVPKADAVPETNDNAYETELGAEYRSPRSDREEKPLASSVPVTEFDKDYFVLSPSAAKRLKKDTHTVSPEAEEFVRKYVSRPTAESSNTGRKSAISSHGAAVTLLEREKTSSVSAELERVISAAQNSPSEGNANSVTDTKAPDKEGLPIDVFGKETSADAVGEEGSVRDEEPIFDKNAAIRRLKSEIDDNDTEIMRYNAIIEKSKKSIRDSKKEYTKAKKEYDDRSFDALVADIITFLSAFFTVYFLVKWIADRGSEVFRALFLVTLLFTAVMLPFTVLKNYKVRPYKKTMRRARDVIRDSKTWIEESEREIRILKEERRDLKKQKRDYR